MYFIFKPMKKADVLAIVQWRYEGEYAVYNLDSDPEDDASEMLDRRSPYYAVWNERNELIGFFCYGSAAQVGPIDEPSLYSEDKTITIGLGLRPDLTGQGNGLALVEAGLEFARQAYAPAYFRLFVMAFNQRALKVYERAGFRKVGVYFQQRSSGPREFVEMRRPA